MTSASTSPATGSPLSRGQVWFRAALVLLLLFIFLSGITGLGSGFKGLGKDALKTFFAATSNPFMGLTVGILATTLVQSSSVTTSMIVALAAAPGSPLPIANAIPMIMGANIGTTVTNTIVALAHIGQPREFKRAFAAATCHDFFNFMTVAVLLPLEIATGVLEKLSYAVAQSVTLGGPGKLPNPVKAATKGAVKPVKAALESLFPDSKIAAVALILLSGLVIFGSLLLIVKNLRELTQTKMRAYVSGALDASPYAGIVVGIAVTIMVQSSSITTSVMVPLAGAGIVTVAQVFPITLGANIGTTFTAILASMAAPEETAHLAVQIAAVHLMFNLIGVFLVYPWPKIRAIPIAMAEKLADIAVRSRKVALIYVAMLFYGLPALAVLISKL